MTIGSFPFIKKTAILQTNYFAVSHVISRLFLKWCSSGIVSASPWQEIIDFTDFFEILQDTAVTDE